VREPHRLLFPLGALLGAVGVLPWIPFALGLQSVYQPIFASIGFRSIVHPVVEVQASLTCFAAGFVLSRLGPLRAWQLALAAAAPIAVVVFAALDRWALAQLAWACEALLVAAVALRRRRAPMTAAAIAWAPAGLLCGFAGAALAWIGERGGEQIWLYDLGRALVWQGLFTGLVLASVGLLPADLRASMHEHARMSERRWPSALAHFALASIFCASFPLEASRPRLAYALRALATLLALIGPLRRTLAADGPRLHRTLTRLAPHLLPIGFLLIALDPGWRRIGLHIVYLGAFSSLALALVLSVLTPLPERAPAALVHGRLDLVFTSFALLAMSLAGRVLLEADPQNFRIWLGTASLSFAGLLAISLGLLSPSRGRPR
jgi:hypothetical protein